MFNLEVFVTILLPFCFLLYRNNENNLFNKIKETLKTKVFLILKYNN